MDRLFNWTKRWGLPGSFTLTCLMSLEAIVLFCVYPRTGRLLAMIAMLFSSVGDILLMNFHRLFTKIPHFEIGACSFMIAHVFYAWAYGHELSAFGFPRRANAGTVCAGIVLALMFVTVVLLIVVKKRTKPRFIPLMAVYLCFIGLDFLAVGTYAFAMDRWFSYLAFAGALSFLISDWFIGLDIVAQTPKLRELVWVFYPIGQIIMIACA